MAGENQLRGWKEIAAFLGASVRTAKRWERDRFLPTHRQSGGGRDVVFAFREELERWQHAEPARARGESPETPEPAAPVGDESIADRGVADGPKGQTFLAKRRRLIALAGTLVVAGLAAAVLWLAGWPGHFQSGPTSNPQRRAERPGPSGDPAPIILTPVQLEFARPDGFSVTIAVADGGAGEVGGSPGHPALILRPRLARAGLILEIARADGRPMKDLGAASQPFVLLLDPNVTVRVPHPFPFSIRWVSGDSSSGR